MDINAARIAASFHLGLDSAILKLLKKWSRVQWIFKLQKVRRNQIYNTKVYFTRIVNFPCRMLEE